MFCLFQQVLLKARSFAHEAGLPFLITEYKDGLQGGPGNATVHSGHHGDRSYAAAFVMRNIPLLTSLDIDVEINATTSWEKREFARIRKEQGVKAAIAWRDARFADGA